MIKYSLPLPFLLIILLFSCQSETTNQQQEKDISDSGITRMKDSISNIVQRINFQQATYENKERAAMIARQLNDKAPPMLLFNYAKEKLNGGQTDEAIKVITDLISKNPSLQTVNKNSKMLHEFLGICYLRKAEQDNCVANHTDQSCIVPIAAKGIHTNKTGSQKAIEKYLSILEVFPEDNQSKWLLNIAYMTLDKYPNEVPKKLLIKTSSPNDAAPLQNIATQAGLDYNELSGGVIIDDFNNDGLLDIITSSWGSQGKMKYFQNNGAKGFIDKSKESSLATVHGGLNLKQGDYNNDGWMDFYVLRGAWKPNLDWGVLPNSLIKNNGDGTFSDVTFEANLYTQKPTQSSEWLDFDNDGWLDLFVANETTKASKQKFTCELFKNNGDGTFTEIAEKVGADVVGYFKGVNAGDINNDGWLDLFLSNLRGGNTLLLNTSKDGKFTTFKNISSNANVAKPDAAFPCWFFDYNNDGLEDLYVASYDQTAFKNQGGEYANDLLGLAVNTERNCLYKNNGNNTFTDVTTSFFKEKMLSTMGCNIGDIDNDGFMDFYLGTGAPDYRAIVPNRFFLNNQGKSFTDKTFEYNLGHIQKGHGIAFADINNDGSQEIYAVMGGAFQGDKFPNAMFENLNHKNNWLKIKLRGTKSNRSGVGAKLKLTIKSPTTTKTIYRRLSAGASFGANPLFFEVGLGDATEIVDCQISWPNGKNEFISYSNININQSYLIHESGTIDSLELVPFEFNKSVHQGHHHHH